MAMGMRARTSTPMPGISREKDDTHTEKDKEQTRNTSNPLTKVETGPEEYGVVVYANDRAGTAAGGIAG